MEVWAIGLASALGVLVTPVCSFFIIYYCFPHYLIRLTLSIRQFKAGMKIKYIGDENMVFCYGERGAPSPHKPSIVFVHGYSSSKDQWVPIIKQMPSDLHLIALDLPGHGATSIPDKDVELGLEYILETLSRFLDLVGLSDQKIHLVGASLGGAIVGVFTVHHPERVEKVTMVCPAIETPIDSDFAIELRKAMALGMKNVTTEHCKLLPTDMKGIKMMFEMCCYHKDMVKLSDQVFKGILTLRLEKTDYYLRLFKAITNEENFGMLAKVAPKITPPSQVIWGRHDELIHVSGAEVLRSKLPDCKRVDVIERCGHAIDLDRPGAFTKYLMKFVDNDFEQTSSGE